MGAYHLTKIQKFNASVDEMWDFISDPANLKTITPDHMGFDITSGHLPSRIYEGMMIAYKVSPVLGIPMNWLTEITHVRDKEFFVDEQRIGPYSLWHHEHHLIAIDKGVVMKDLITYKPPFGILGQIANTLFIKKQLENIFEYRKEKLEEIFGPY